jgi:hypothetical protein
MKGRCKMDKKELMGKVNFHINELAKLCIELGSDAIGTEVRTSEGKVMLAFELRLGKSAEEMGKRLRADAANDDKTQEVRGHISSEGETFVDGEDELSFEESGCVSKSEFKRLKVMKKIGFGNGSGVESV